jgi:hypothetical protein
MSPVNPGTPLRTLSFLMLYAASAALALVWFAQLNSHHRTLALVASVAVVSLGAGLPIRVTVAPTPWRRMCRARNVAL